MRFRSSILDACLIVTLCVLGAAIHQTSRVLDAEPSGAKREGRVGPLPDGRVVRVLSLGFERLVADLFWLRTVYYIGDERSHAAGYPDGARLAELVTDVDPYFTTAYVIMNAVLSTLRGDPEASIRLLEKGIRFNGHYWRLHFLQGFNYFFGRGDYAQAAHHIRMAAARGGPDYLPFLATRLYVGAGQAETAIAFVLSRLREAETPEVRERLETRLRDLRVARDVSQINGAMERYRAEHGVDPPDVPSLVIAGFLAEEPRDPEGNAYEIRNGRAESVLETDDLRLKRGAGI
ncbi:MAG: hypothetical protein V3T14_09485 [Myxococcota bacterium]